MPLIFPHSLLGRGNPLRAYMASASPIADTHRHQPQTASRENNPDPNTAASPRRQKAGKEAIDSTESGGHGRRARMKVSQLSKRKSSAEGQNAGVVHSTGSEEGAGVCAGPEAVGSEKHRF